MMFVTHDIKSTVRAKLESLDTILDLFQAKRILTLERVVPVYFGKGNHHFKKESYTLKARFKEAKN